MKNIIKNITRSIVIVAALVGLATITVAPTYAAIDPQQQICQGTGGSGGSNCAGNSTQDNLGNIFKTIVNTLLFLIGAVAVIVIIVAGFRYVTSNGDASKVKAAKDTILYAVIGLIVAILAFAIVNFVLGAFK